METSKCYFPDEKELLEEADWLAELPGLLPPVRLLLEDEDWLDDPLSPPRPPDEKLCDDELLELPLCPTQARQRFRIYPSKTTTLTTVANSI